MQLPWFPCIPGIPVFPCIPSKLGILYLWSFLIALGEPVLCTGDYGYTREYREYREYPRNTGNTGNTREYREYREYTEYREYREYPGYPTVGPTALRALLIVKHGPTGLIILLYCRNRPNTALRALLYYYY